MIKRSIYFGNPCYLKKRDQQLVVEYPDSEDLQNKSVPIEDIGMVVLDHPRITITHSLISALNNNNAAILSCNDKHLPEALMLPMASHHAYTERLYRQLDSSQPLRKNMWQQTVVAKIQNQSAVLQKNGIDVQRMDFYERQVKSGDPDNVEGRAAAYYWSTLVSPDGFKRHRFGEYPNAMLNYGYAILRGVVARSLVGSGLLPAVGIFHRNKYNPYCLADDIMEPYRPVVDQLVLEWIELHDETEELTIEMKRHLLQIPAVDVVIEGKSSPLMVGMQRTAASVAECFEGVSRKILYPVIQ